MKLPESIKLANLPTKIEKLDRLSRELGGPRIYVKRDDQTGSEISGNKVRKLEFTVAEAMRQGCDMLITCGGVQSNHARATAAVAAKLGMSSCLVLRGTGEEEIDGNRFLDLLLGAKIKFITPEQYSSSRNQIMEEVKKEMKKGGYKPYIIPEGASNGLGALGYFKAMQEIMQQEKEMGVRFDAILMAVGSGGTYAGMFLGNKLLKNNAEIYGVNVCDNEEYFQNAIYNIIHESYEYIDEKIELEKKDIKVIDGYVGLGYALSRPEELDFLYHVAKLEGLILDPVYTGKAMFGLADCIKRGKFKQHKNVLFLHTGGLYGLFPTKGKFQFK